MFGTSGFAGFSIDSILAPGLVHKGSARILATARAGIVCSAMLANYGSNPPSVIGSLSVVKKTTQQGD
jgi:hypothetical protein